MRTAKFGAASPSAMPVVDVTKPGGGVQSDIITDTAVHNGQWFAITALSAAVVGLESTSIATVNGADPTTVASTALVAGNTYTIVSVGTTNWVALGASANQSGVTFVANGSGSGNGTAQAAGTANFIGGLPIPAGATIYGSFQQIAANSGVLIAYRD